MVILNKRERILPLPHFKKKVFNTLLLKPFDKPNKKVSKYYNKIMIDQ